MDISIIICTYNRGHHLKNVLKSLSEQLVPGDLKWEIIVVDNNSTDDTHEITMEFSRRVGLQVKYIKEVKQGLSYARNRGIEESAGRYIAFTDDDAIAGSSWVAVLHKTFQTYNCDCVGGRIYLKPVKELPKWLTKELWGFLAYLDYGDSPFQITDHYVYGTNMAFSRQILNKAGYFNTDLGRTGYTPVGGEETELLKRIMQSGATVYYQPGAEIHHVIEAYKLKKNYFRRLHYYEGFSNGKSYSEVFSRHLKGIPLFIFPKFLKAVAHYFQQPSVRMQMNIWWYLGFMKGRIASQKDPLHTAFPGRTPVGDDGSEEHRR